MTNLILPPSAAQDVQRGRDASLRIADMVREHRASGDDVLEVRVSKQVADAMRAMFASFAQFDGVLPPRVHGAPFFEGGTGGRDFVIKTRRRGNVEL